MKKSLLTISALFLCLTLKAQVMDRSIQHPCWEPAHIENYIGGVMILSAFPLIEHVNTVLYNKHVLNNPIPDYDKWVNQRTMFAVSYIGTSLGITYLIRKIRLKVKKKV